MRKKVEATADLFGDESPSDVRIETKATGSEEPQVIVLPDVEVAKAVSTDPDEPLQTAQVVECKDDEMPEIGSSHAGAHRDDVTLEATMAAIASFSEYLATAFESIADDLRNAVSASRWLHSHSPGTVGDAIKQRQSPADVEFFGNGNPANQGNHKEPDGSQEDQQSQLVQEMPADSMPVWKVPTEATGILDNIPRFGDKRKAAVLVACGTLAAIRDKIRSKGGLTSIEGVGGKIADAIEENLANWMTANSDRWGKNGDGEPPVEHVSENEESEGDDESDEPDDSRTSDEVKQETESTSENKPDASAMTEDELLESLNVIGLTEESDDQTKRAHGWLVDCVRRYRQSGKSGYAVPPHCETQFKRGAAEAENGVPGDDCIYTNDDAGMAWAWGWVVWTFENMD